MPPPRIAASSLLRSSMNPVRYATIDRTRLSRSPKWYWTATLFFCPAAIPMSRNGTAAMPRSAKSCSAV